MYFIYTKIISYKLYGNSLCNHLNIPENTQTRWYHYAQPALFYLFFLLIMSETALKTEYFFIIKRFIEFLLNNDELKTSKLNYHSLLI